MENRMIIKHTLNNIEHIMCPCAIRNPIKEGETPIYYGNLHAYEVGGWRRIYDPVRFPNRFDGHMGWICKECYAEGEWCAKED